MEVTVKMKIDEFQEFLDWKKDRTIYEKDISGARRKGTVLAAKVLLALDLSEDETHYIVFDQDHLDELAQMASEMLED